MEKIPSKGSVNIGNEYFFHKENARIYFQNSFVELTYNEVLLLELLINSNEIILPFDTIDQEIWPSLDANEGKRRTLIYRLNKKFPHKIIKSIRKLGCKLDTNNK